MTALAIIGAAAPFVLSLYLIVNIPKVFLTLPMLALYMVYVRAKAFRIRRLYGRPAALIWLASRPTTFAEFKAFAASPTDYNKTRKQTLNHLGKRRHA